MTLDVDLTLRVRQQSRRLGVSTASLMHQAWAQVLSRLCGKGDVVFGTVLFGRMQGGVGADRAQGMFINTLPIRIAVDGRGVAQAVLATHAQLSALLRHEHAPLALAQRCSGVAAPLPLFSSLFNYRHSAPNPADEAWMGIESLGGGERTNYPVTMAVDDMGDHFVLVAQVNSTVSPERVCGYLEAALINLVVALEEAQDTAVADIDMLPASERDLLLHSFNATAVEYPHAQNLDELFEQQVARTPHATALVWGGQSLTYAQLSERANRLAAYLRTHGVGPDKLVGLCTERGFEMIVGLLAILKAGGAYVPLDPAYPQERLAYMLQDSAPVIVLTQQRLLDKVACSGLPVLCLNENGPVPYAPPSFQGASSAGPTDLAYVIYTSGSTGQPKGTLLHQRGVINLNWWYGRQFAFTSTDKVLLLSSFSFDLTQKNIYATLFAGAELHLPPDSYDPAQFSSYIEEKKITLLNCAPSAFYPLLATGGNAELASLRHVMLGGEPIQTGLVRQAFEGAARYPLISNTYGPTEASDVVSFHTWDPADPMESLPIGKPIANTQLYLLDSRRQVVAIGVLGELYVGGAGVARGYLNRPELTAERFIADPFSNETGARLYKTGDLGRWLADGSIEYLGRNDFQVKIRGFRIELGEIETCLVGCAGVREAVVLAREDAPGDQRLVAYLVPEEGAELDLAVVRAALAAQLAAFMVPSAFVLLTRLPLTPNGKLDRKALPVPSGDAYASEAYETPQGEVEEKLAAIWAELLQVDQVGRNDNFFKLGGHSLLAIQVISRVKAEFGVEISLSRLFACPTISTLEECVVDAQLAQFDVNDLQELAGQAGMAFNNNNH
ncbi:amino acid adenylation domain-containing protein [Janthinobacterium lividum]|nr:amino acid adenylation domain-containing protein [Janthinobacterium lividum]